MAIQFIVIISILVTAGIFFFVGRSSESVAQRGIFIAFAGLLILLSGVFMMSEGLELPIQDAITKTGDTHALSYQVIENVEGSAGWALFNSVFWFGSVVLLFSPVYIVIETRKIRREQDRDVLDW